MENEIYIDGVNVAGCKDYDDGICCNDDVLTLSCEKTNCMYKQLKRLEQENKSLYEEKNCLHKIIDRLLENAGYSKDIASAEDFEDVYEDMQRKINEFAELEQENKELKNRVKSRENELANMAEQANMRINTYRSALEEIRDKAGKILIEENKDNYWDLYKILSDILEKTLEVLDENK